MFKFCQNNVLTIFNYGIMKHIKNSIILFLCFTFISHADEVVIFDFTELELSKLEVRKVRGADNKTIYIPGSNDNGSFLKAVADNAASGLGKEVKIDLNKKIYLVFKKAQKKVMILQLECL